MSRVTIAIDVTVALLLLSVPALSPSSPPAPTARPANSHGTSWGAVDHPTGAMQNLDKLTGTGLPIFDLNSEHLDANDW